jgi:alcohol dehydrogenase class IV
MRNLGDLELRRRMALAALTAGLAFSNTRTALAHSISYDMTMHHGLPHGIACSFTLGMVLQRAIGTNAERDAVLARCSTCRWRRRRSCCTTSSRASGVSTRFESYGVDAAESARMIANALDGVRGKNFIGVASSGPTTTTGATA